MPVNKEEIDKAIIQVKEQSNKRKFVQSIELLMALQDIDVKKPENRMNELIELPHSPSLHIRVAVFATGDLALRARNAGADRVYSREDLDGIVNDKKKARKLVSDMDFFIAETSLMSLIGRTLGSILGPKGKMPTPIPPTAPIDVLIERLRKTVQLRIRDQLNVQCKVGTEDMDTNALTNNITDVLSRLEGKFEKGLRNVREIRVKATMGSPVKIKF